MKDKRKAVLRMNLQRMFQQILSQRPVPVLMIFAQTCILQKCHQLQVALLALHSSHHHTQMWLYFKASVKYLILINMQFCAPNGQMPSATLSLQGQESISSPNKNNWILPTVPQSKLLNLFFLCSYFTQILPSLIFNYW